MAAILLHSRSETVLVVTTLSFVLATFFVVARLISRFRILKKSTWDDHFIIVAWFIAFGLSFAIDFGVSKGLGKHSIDILDVDVLSLRRSEYAFTILYNPALMATKTAILIFYLRVAKDTQKVLRYASYVTLAIVNVDGIVLTFLNAFRCHPISAAWNTDGTNNNCLSIITLYLCSAPVNIITDLAILCLPIPVLTGMQLPQRQKTVLVVTFALGIFVTIVDIIRIYYLQEASVEFGEASFLHSEISPGADFAYNASFAFMWSAVEVNVGIICACIPTLKPLIRRILPAMLYTNRVGTHHSEPDTFDSLKFDSQPHRSLDFTPLSPIPSPRQAVLHHPRLAEESIDMIEFLNLSRPTFGEARDERRPTCTSEDSVYFGFVNMKRPKSMLSTRGTESFKYCIMVTILFALWGFSYGLLNTLNNEIAKLAHESQGQTVALTSTYFGAYLVGPLALGQWVLRHGGFKATFIVGLCIYGTGTLMFWPSAVLSSFPGFIISNFVVGFGLSVLETAANPFIALCGPPEHAEYRLLLAQGVQAVSSILSQVLAEKILFHNLARTSSLIDVQWTYLTVTLFTVVLALFFYYMPLPEATDADLQQQAEELDIHTSQTFTIPKLSISLSVVKTTLALACVAQFAYLAAQESLSIYFQALLSSLSTRTAIPLTLSKDNYLLLGHGLFAAGRFLFAPLTLLFPPRLLLLGLFLASTLTATCTMAIHHHSPNAAAAPALLLFFLEAPIWPLIFSIGLRGLGVSTKMGAALITASAGPGGAIFPFVMWAIQHVSARSVQYSFCVIIAVFALGTLFPVYLNLAGKARRQVDPARTRAMLGLKTCGTGREGRARRLSDRLGRLAWSLRNGSWEGTSVDQGKDELRRSPRGGCAGFVVK